METECDFVEIDNNIAARLQIPSPQQQKENDLPESLPVPMLANFGHFEESDEKESSFMTSDVDGKRSEETAGSGEPAGSVEKSETTHRDTLSGQEQNVENTETGLQKQEADEENSDQNLPVQGGVNKEDPFSSFLEGNDIHSIGSIPLFCGEDQKAGAEERRSSDNSNTTSESLQSGLEIRTENEISELECKHDQKSSHDNSESTSNTTGADSLFSVANEMFVGTSETGKENGRTDRTESLDREFVFVNRDGTAQGSPMPPRHPLETSDEFFY